MRPEFERHLRDLGYGSWAITHAFRTLDGPGTVDDALAELAEQARVARIGVPLGPPPVPLEFEVVEDEPGSQPGRSLTIASVARDDHGLRIAYAVRPRLSWQGPAPRVQARDDRARAYQPLGGFFGFRRSQERTCGVITLPGPQQHASLLRVRLSWSKDPTSLWERPAFELRIPLR